MIISVASGKGGTGKTTVATNLAKALDCKVTLLDCDVEEPNAHLFLKPQIKNTQSVYSPIPEVDLSKCTLCKKCMDICNFSAITVVGKTVLTFPGLCHGCGGCLMVCPEKAITEGGRELGVIESGKAGKVDFFHGKLRVGEAMAPPLIRAVLKHIDDGGITIIDAPPGNSCPVVSSIKESDFVLLVTEPTPFGLHDLMLAAEAVKLFQLPMGLVINRAETGRNIVHEYAKNAGIPVLLEIPFQREIAEAYSKGILVIDEFESFKQGFIDLYDAIKKEVIYFNKWKSNSESSRDGEVVI